MFQITEAYKSRQPHPSPAHRRLLAVSYDHVTHWQFGDLSGTLQKSYPAMIEGKGKRFFLPDVGILALDAISSEIWEKKIINV